jgi:hypothetical protein
MHAQKSCNNSFNDDDDNKVVRERVVGKDWWIFFSHGSWAHETLLEFMKLNLSR